VSLQDCTETVYGPCNDYATIEDLMACGPCSTLDLSGTPEENPRVQRALDSLRWASRRVFEASGGAWWGCCEIEVAPCRPTECSYPAGRMGWPPPLGSLPAVPWGTVNSMGDPVFVNMWGCSCPAADPCSCGAIGDRVLLPYGPVRDVSAVIIGGVELEQEGHWTLLRPEGVLVRTDGEMWPACQDRTVPLGQPGTWSIVYRHGFDPPPELRPLVAAFACELMKSCEPGDCMLPPGFRVVQRDGVEFGVMEPAEYREQGLTGFGPLDDWLMLMRGGHASPTLAPRAYRPSLTPELM
jgi:hypothetical protein